MDDPKDDGFDTKHQKHPPGVDYFNHVRVSGNFAFHVGNNYQGVMLGVPTPWAPMVVNMDREKALELANSIIAAVEAANASPPPPPEPTHAPAPGLN